MLEKYSSRSPSAQTPMTLRFAFSSPAHIVASFLGSGVIRPASGTWGTLAGLLVYMALQQWIGFWMWIVLIIATFVVGAWACEVTGHDIGVHDHSSIVIDEVFAIWMVLVSVPATIAWQVGAFCAFRFFDIVKVQPAKYFDTNKHWQNGWGVMLDDAVAAVYAMLLLFAIHRIIG